jgi:transposase
MRYELTDHEWSAIKPYLPNKPRGVPRVNDRRVLNGIFWVLRCGAPWRDLPEAFGPYTTCYNRFVRWRRAGVWSRIIDALAATHDAAVQMIDTSIVRVHQHAACITRNQRQSMGRSRGGLTSKIHAVVDSNDLPVRLAWRGTRRSTCRKTAVSSEIRGDAACRPRLRRRLDQRACHEEGRVGQHPAEKQSQRSDLLQPLSLPCSQPGRAILQQDQTMSSGGDALRQACRQLSCLRSTRVYPAMAGWPL